MYPLDALALRERLFLFNLASFRMSFYNTTEFQISSVLRKSKMTNNNFSEKERIDTFSKALAIVLRRIAGLDSEKTKTMPKNLPKLSKKQEDSQQKKK